MKINPVLPFRAVVAGSPWPVTFTPEDAFAPGSEAAQAALDLGCLSDADAAVVRAAQGEGSDTVPQKTPENDPDPAPPPGTEAKSGGKSRGAAPENKAADA